MGGRRAVPRIAVLGAMLLLLTGCWDQRPVEGRALVEAVGVAPTTRPDTWAWTFVFPNPTESVSSLSSLSPSDQIYAVTVSAATWTGALLKAQERTTRDLYFGQFRVLAISPRLSAVSWDRLISTFNRSGRVLKTFWIVAGHPAGAVVATAPVSEGAPLYALFKLLACHCQPYFWAQRAWQVWDRLTTPGVTPIVPVITVAGPHVLNTAFATVGPHRVFLWSARTSAGWAYLTQHVVKGGLVVRTPWGLVGLNQVRGRSRTRILTRGRMVVVTDTLAYHGALEDLPPGLALTTRQKTAIARDASRTIAALCDGALQTADAQQVDPFGWHRQQHWAQNTAGRPWPAPIRWQHWSVHVIVHFRITGEGVAHS